MLSVIGGDLTVVELWVLSFVSWLLIELSGPLTIVIDYYCIPRISGSSHRDRLLSLSESCFQMLGEERQTQDTH